MKPTIAQRKVLNFLEVHVRTRGPDKGPTDQEIADGVGLKHHGSARELVKRLVAKGWVSRTPRKHRSIRLLGQTAFTISPGDAMSRAIRELASGSGLTPEAVIIAAIRDRVSLSS